MYALRIPTKNKVVPVLLSGALYLSASPVLAEQDLTELGIEELLRTEITVTSASRSAKKIADTAAAIHVLTQEDIRRSGATSIPEALR
jgi:iron complex outermembrane receptor protein